MISTAMDLQTSFASTMRFSITPVAAILTATIRPLKGSQALWQTSTTTDGTTIAAVASKITNGAPTAMTTTSTGGSDTPTSMETDTMM
jgi:hypothetical protein